MIFEKQGYQQNCLENIMKILQNFDFNRQDNLKKCLQEFYKNTDIPIKNIDNKLHLDILMETGTGKTFTYLNLIFELHKQFKQNKFIIFVPRKAILESIKQNIKLTKDYFYSEYKKHLKAYYSENQSLIINHYINNSDELSVLILTNSAIDKKDNLLNQHNENLYNKKSIFENIIDLKPISIIDEPHLLKGKAFNEYFSKLDSLYFRFGATFPKEKKQKEKKQKENKEQEFILSNVAYCLDSISAFNSYLVKQVRVHTIGSNANDIFLKNYKNNRATFTYTSSGIEKEKTLKIGDALSLLDNATLTGVKNDKAYFDNGKIIGKKEIYALDEHEITALLAKAIDLHFEKEEQLFKQNIKALSLFFIPNIADFRGENPFIKNTFESLYRAKRAEILKQDLDENYRAYLQKDLDENGSLRVYQGYFSGDSSIISKKKESNKENLEANDIKLILQEKEKLLSFDTPLRFIFSVWALQEGWDNPNIFTLTKLAYSSSDISRHQQVGRGLRLCVNDKGKRITHSFMEYDDSSFYDINYLDVVVNAKEIDYIENLQNEINDISYSFDSKILSMENLSNLLNQNLAIDLISLLKHKKMISYNEEQDNFKIIKNLYENTKDDKEIQELLGDKFQTFLNFINNNNKNTHNQVKNANKQEKEIVIKRNLANDFKELWDKINKKATMSYKDIDEKDLINAVIESFNQATIQKEQIFYTKKIFDSQTNTIITKEITTLESIDYKASIHKDIKNLLIDFSKSEKIPLSFLLQIYKNLDKSNFENSPKKAFNLLKDFIKDKIHSNLIQSVSYDFTQNTFSNSHQNLVKNGALKQSIPLQKLAHFRLDEKTADNYLYESIVYDSEIEKDISKENQKKLDSKTIKVFAKLPKLSIPTPYKHYEPDFAYFLEEQNGKKIFFICEAKGYDKDSDIPEDEQKKIEYARVFFEQLSKSLEKENIKVIFEKRINRQELIECLNEALHKDA